MMLNPSYSPLQDVVYTITETTPHTSLDPLEGDKTNNLSVQRMLYLTPLEVGPDDKLVSQVLSEFYYDSEENQIIFKVRDDQFFSDGFKIEPNDIAYSIIRMLKKRPKFPVIKNIQGKEEWLSEGGKLDTPPL